jgi:hypothetical protein
MTEPCPREREIVTAGTDRRRSRRMSDDLLAHVDSCDACREAAMLVHLMSEPHDHAREIYVPAAGQVWWRAAVRARLEAVQAAARPLTWVHGVAGACALGLLLALVGMSWPLVREAAGSFGNGALAESSLGAAATYLGTAALRSVPFVIIAGACVLIAPFAIYFVLLSDD